MKASIDKYDSVCRLCPELSQDCEYKQGELKQVLCNILLNLSLGYTLLTNNMVTVGFFLSISLLGLSYAKHSNLLIGAFHGLGFEDFHSTCDLPEEYNFPSDLWYLLLDMQSYARICNFSSYSDAIQSLIPEEPLDHVLKVKLQQASSSSFDLLYAIDDYEVGLNAGSVLAEILGLAHPTTLKFSYSRKSAAKLSQYPTVVLHGLGDACLYSSMSHFTSYISNATDNYAVCIEIGSGVVSNWLIAIKDQADIACSKILADEKLRNGFNLVAMSQGSMIARGIVEKCDVKVVSLITLGGPHMGVATIPSCHSGFFCDIVNDIVGKGVYLDFVQNHIGPAGYYKDQYEMKTYLEKSSYLADINNERQAKNDKYKEKLDSLERLVLIKFDRDSIVDPKESAWLYFYAENSNQIVKFNETDIYRQDSLGLQKLEEEGKIIFESIDAEHVQVTDKDIDEKVIPYII
jgi:palmitoyl-protein thioesterase